MAVALGVVLLAVGLVLVFDAVTIDISYINDHVLGTICLVVGALAIVLGLILNGQRGRHRTIVEERPIDDRSGR